MDGYILQDRDGKELIALEIGKLNMAHQYKPHTHSKLEISLVKSGNGLYHIGDRTYDICSNDIFIIGNTERHNIEIVDNESLVNMVVHFESEFLWSMFGQDPDYRFLKVFFARNENYQHRLDRDNPATKNIVKMFYSIEKEFKEQPLYYDMQVKILLENIFLTVMREFDYFESSDNLKSITTAEAYKTKEVLRHIDLNLNQPLSLQELAKIACLSPTYFSSLFKRYNGITLSEYITKKRVALAIELMHSTNYSLTEIAIQCGFNNSTSFHKAFKRSTGEAPGFYRKNPQSIHRMG